MRENACIKVRQKKVCALSNTLFFSKSSMSAVLLSEAWNDPPPPSMEPTPKARAAKRVVIREPIEEEEVATGAPEEKNILPPPDTGVTEAIAPQTRLVEMLLDEIHTLRVEQSRRCTVYLAVAGVLFALLFMYIDRLQRRLQRPEHLPNWSMHQVPVHRPMQSHAPAWG